MTAHTTGRIAFQGEPGAYSHEACRQARPGMEALPCRTFEDAIEAVRKGEADLAMLPVENSTYGRVPDIHSLLPGSGLHIIDEAFVRVHIALLAVPGTPLSSVRSALSHIVLLGQCRDFLRTHNIKAVTGTDTAGSAKEVADRGDPSLGALASELAGEIYGLDVLARQIEDQSNNTTRFLVIGKQSPSRSGLDRTSLLIGLMDRPGSLNAILTALSEEEINLAKIESRPIKGKQWK